MANKTSASKVGDRKMRGGKEYVLRRRKDKNGKYRKVWVLADKRAAPKKPAKATRETAGSAKGHAVGDRKKVNQEWYIVGMTKHGQKRWLRMDGERNPYHGQGVGFGMVSAPHVVEEPEDNPFFGFSPSTGPTLGRVNGYASCVKDVHNTLEQVFPSNEYVKYDYRALAIEFLSQLKASGMDAAISNLQFLAPTSFSTFHVEGSTEKGMVSADIAARLELIKEMMQKALRPCEVNMGVPAAPIVGVPAAPAL